MPAAGGCRDARSYGRTARAGAGIHARRQRLVLIVYECIVALLAILVARVVLRSASPSQQATGTLVLVVLLLRLFLVK
jgi:hypothetical protein